jgi:hypothetical protein
VWRLAFAGLICGVAACGPSEICKKYVACQKAYDDTVDTTAYEDGGTCWQTAPAANTCNTQCQDALFALSRVEGAPAECTDDGTGT